MKARRWVISRYGKRRPTQRTKKTQVVGYGEGERRTVEARHRWTKADDSFWCKPCERSFLRIGLILSPQSCANLQAEKKGDKLVEKCSAKTNKTLLTLGKTFQKHKAQQAKAAAPVRHTATTTDHYLSHMVSGPGLCSIHEGLQARAAGLVSHTAIAACRLRCDIQDTLD
jgi:hypothetical protein